MPRLPLAVLVLVLTACPALALEPPKRTSLSDGGIRGRVLKEAYVVLKRGVEAVIVEKKRFHNGQAALAASCFSALAALSLLARMTEAASECMPSGGLLTPRWTPSYPLGCRWLRMSTDGILPP